MSITKKIVIGIFTFFFLVILTQFYIDTESYLDYDKRQKKRVEIDGSGLIGYDQGKKNWEISSEEAWIGSNKFIFYLNYLKDGKLYDDDGALVLENLRADEARVNSKSKTIIAKNNISGSFLKSDGDDVLIEVNADELKYFSYNNRTYMMGNVIIKRENDSITASKIELDTDENIVYINEDFQVKSEEYLVTADEMIIYIDDDRSELKGNVKIYRAKTPASELVDLDPREGDLKQKETWIQADYVKQEEFDDDFVVTSMEGNVTLFQEGKTIKASKGIYKRDISFELDGNVDIEMDSMTWALRPEKRNDISNSDIQERLDTPIFIKSGYLFVDLNDNNMILKDQVLFIQSNMQTKSEALFFNDTNDTFSLYDGVVLKKGQRDSLYADAIDINILTESFKTRSAIRIVEEKKYISSILVSDWLNMKNLDTLSIESMPDWVQIKKQSIIRESTKRG